MDFVSVRVITHDVERLATFWEQVTGLPAEPVVIGSQLGSQRSLATLMLELLTSPAADHSVKA